MNGQLRPVPLGRVIPISHLANDVLDDLVAPFCDKVLGVVAMEDLVPPFVDDPALSVHHLVILEHVLANLEVLRLDLGLCSLDRLRNHLCLNGHIWWDLELRHDRSDAFVCKAAHEVIL